MRQSNFICSFNLAQQNEFIHHMQCKPLSFTTMFQNVHICLLILYPYLIPYENDIFIKINDGHTWPIITFHQSAYLLSFRLWWTSKPNQNDINNWYICNPKMKPSILLLFVNGRQVHELTAFSVTFPKCFNVLQCTYLNILTILHSIQTLEKYYNVNPNVHGAKNKTLVDVTWILKPKLTASPSQNAPEKSNYSNYTQPNYYMTRLYFPITQMLSNMFMKQSLVN